MLPVQCGIQCPKSPTWASNQVVREVAGDGLHKVLEDIITKDPPNFAFHICTWVLQTPHLSLA